MSTTEIAWLVVYSASAIFVLISILGFEHPEISVGNLLAFVFVIFCPVVNTFAAVFCFSSFFDAFFNLLEIVTKPFRSILDYKLWERK